jgi:hypothetical protein
MAVEYGSIHAFDVSHAVGVFAPMLETDSVFKDIGAAASMILHLHVFHIAVGTEYDADDDFIAYLNQLNQNGGARPGKKNFGLSMLF